ncbi:glycosyltransferase family 4 protein [Chryseobacterium hagamense]|uniref:Glycosyl transferase family 1 domain-containing protein n=1 Tax=Chryseobacterium hagamense TaxID=395935 RepID=A0A511YLT2_9FLAO|nr:glycosyltransferase [Chryseobacterium hagamense]GEN76164.1 hypothetical protein CHA01nite_19040 [Chryseobacterium hagamense]
MKKVIYLTYIPSPYRVDFFNELSKNIDLKVVFYNKSMDNSPWKKDDKVNNFDHTFLFENSKLKGIFTLFKLLRSHKNDILVVGGYSLLPEIFTIFYCIFFRKEFILNSDGGFITEGFFKTNFKKILISSAKYWLSSGINTSKTLIYYGAISNHISEYSFSSLHENEVLDSPLTKQEVNQLRNQLDLKKDVRYLIFVGQLVHRKGVDTLLKSLEFLNDPSIEVLIIGTGTELESLKIIMQNPNIPNKVNFLGKQSKDVVLKYLKIADLFVFPSREDIWGLVLNEAIGNALPIITTYNVGSAFSLINQGKNGLIVEAEDSYLLAQAIKNILSEDLEIMKKISLNIARKYTIEEMVREHLVLFNMVNNKVKN